MNLTITTEEKRLNGAKYYVANVQLENSDITNQWLSTKSWLKLEDWCHSTFGERPYNEWPTSSSRWFVNNSAFWFRNNDDLLMFVLRWQ
jgi:hypothetical protein